ncbi:hypothetical protein BDW74DRAFT_185866 [Aspergillus multicolor]|uniref:cytochrome P450 n=1 Tax=Aspergillus multicolor TaxID=41759 RepID=UPI003CCD9925
MLGLVILPSTGLALVSYIFILPFLTYLYDPKGLRKLPTVSPLSGLTDLHHCYLSALGYRSKAFYEAHIEKKASILRTGPNSISFGDIRAIKDLYGHGTRCIKDHNYTLLAGSHTQIFEVVDKGDHSRRRKQLSSAVQRLLNSMDEHCTAPLLSGQSIPSHADVTFDFGKWIYLFTIEAINIIAVSSSLGLMNKGSDDVTAEKRDGYLYQARYREAQSYTALGQSTFVWNYKNYHMLAMLSKMSAKWRDVWEKAKPWDDIGRPSNLEWGEVVAEVGAIINAGADTTSIALTNVLEMLLHHPRELERLREEVDSALGESEVVATYDKVKNLPFLRACLDEALRLSPPTSAGLPRRTPPGGAQILGQWIPGDTTVAMAIYTAHRGPEVFPDPEEYRPERWMDPEARKRMEPYFIPFSAGSRGCLGRNISYLEQKLVLASIVHRYEFALPSPDFRLERREALNLLVGELPIKLWRRKL